MASVRRRRDVGGPGSGHRSQVARAQFTPGPV